MIRILPSKFRVFTLERPVYSQAMKIRRHHKLGLDEARNRADRIAAYLAKQYSLTSTWEGDHLNVRGNGVQGRLRDGSRPGA